MVFLHNFIVLDLSILLQLALFIGLDLEMHWRGAFKILCVLSSCAENKWKGFSGKMGSMELRLDHSCRAG